MNITTSNRASFLIYVLLTMASLGAALVLQPTTTTNGCSSGRQGVVGVWDAIHQNANSRSNHNRLAAIPFVMDSSSTATTFGSGPAILDRPAVETRTERVVENGAPIKERKNMGSEWWEVRIYNDSDNTREHVARILVQVTGLTEIAAYQTMMQAHQNGLAVVGQYAYEVAEMYLSALRNMGIVCDTVPVVEDFA